MTESYLHSNYLQHEQFTFDQHPWSVNEENLKNFRNLYCYAKQLGSVLSKRDYNLLTKECLTTLDVIFSEIGSQCSDDYETHFIKELHNESSRLINKELRWYSRKTKSHFVFSSKENIKKINKLKNDKYYFDKLSNGAIADIKDITKPLVDQLKSNAAKNKLTREDLSVNRGLAIHKIRKILNQDFKNLGVLDAVSAYTGRKTQVTGLALELSVPTSSWWKNTLSNLNRPPNTLYAHIDEAIEFPKSILYLSDVTEKNGPTECYPTLYESMNLHPLQEIIGRVIGTVGSSVHSPLKNYYAKQYHQTINSENFRKHFMRLPEQIRFNSHLGWDVLPNSNLESEMMGLGKKMLGSAGTFIVFDGARLFHRGGLIQQNQRLAMQIIFSDISSTQRIVSKVKRILK